MKTREIHDKYLLLENERLSTKGFRCIPLIKPIPDIIAIKGRDLEVYAVEIVHKSSPQPKNYAQAPWFDDVLFAFYPIEPPDFKVNNHVLVKTKYRITIPENVREEMEIKIGSTLELQVVSKDKMIVAVLVR